MVVFWSSLRLFTFICTLLRRSNVNLISDSHPMTSRDSNELSDSDASTSQIMTAIIRSLSLRCIVTTLCSPEVVPCVPRPLEENFLTPPDSIAKSMLASGSLLAGSHATSKNKHASRKLNIPSFLPSEEGITPTLSPWPSPRRSRGRLRLPGRAGRTGWCCPYRQP